MLRLYNHTTITGGGVLLNVYIYNVNDTHIYIYIHIRHCMDTSGPCGTLIHRGVLKTGRITWNFLGPKPIILDNYHSPKAQSYLKISYATEWGTKFPSTVNPWSLGVIYP